jgi:hypothetical protein
MRSTDAATRIVVTDIPESWSWMVRDLVIRIVLSRRGVRGGGARVAASWMGVGEGRTGVQLAFGLVAAPVLSSRAALVQRRRAAARRHERVRRPARPTRGSRPATTR